MATSTSLELVEAKPQRKPNVTDIIPPVDFSFLRLTNVQECETQEPRDISPRRPHPIKTTVTHENGEKKYISRCLRLNNNKFTDINNLKPLAMSLFDHIGRIGWIDLSFNLLSTIDPVLTEFTNLAILYLHGNNITELKEVNKLASLKKLWKLTLHGNDIDKIKGYRQYVLSTIPTLVNLDFSTVTKGDRVTAGTWQAFNSAQRSKRISRD
ncbi:unnamed protein product [Candidula unifasciata]|uniref:Leucine-rich repeat-containing protein 51 n=1 Tax=Candidula unifasciata TaxID=100452 RepID=A0A8S3YZ31_9EUPU|nr:unnamed protein product [Candidula unifasciata]